MPTHRRSRCGSVASRSAMAFSKGCGYASLLRPFRRVPSPFLVPKCAEGAQSEGAVISSSPPLPPARQSPLAQRASEWLPSTAAVTERAILTALTAIYGGAVCSAAADSNSNNNVSRPFLLYPHRPAAERGQRIGQNTRRAAQRPSPRAPPAPLSSNPPLCGVAGVGIACGGNIHQLNPRRGTESRFHSLPTIRRR